MKEHGQSRCARTGALVIALMRVATYAGLLLLFFGLLGIRNWQLRNPSRTLAMTLLTWGCMSLAMHGVYGGYDIGVKKNKPILTGMLLSTLCTDLVTYLALQIMNVNDHNNDHLVLLGPDALMLAGVFALQVLLLYIMIRLGNTVFFRFHAPQRSLLIVGSDADAAQAAPKIGRYRLQWRIEDVAPCDAEDIAERISRADAVFLAGVPDDRRLTLMQECYRQRCDIYCKAQLNDVMLASSRHMVVDDTLFLAVDHCKMTNTQRFVKRLMDIVISVLVLVLLSPMIALIAVAIRAEDHGSVLFRQRRATLNGRTFIIYKFRTMREDGGRAVSATEADERITRVGAFLRRWRLDELPQLMNVLRGDMSLVGPRPEMLENVERYKVSLPAFAYREQMKAGLTGYAQIEGRYNTAPEDKLMLDLMYIEDFSIFEDMKLLLRTATVFFKKDSTEGFHADGRSRQQRADRL
ncbi:MAG: exopolysaccharide biosynthesis polyprenyl glycosylphosphotransferase [bacterium]|nr:exopolysaccharide biosynthesis polyprenyl glycosylphosphotransferase [bacterium]